MGKINKEKQRAVPQKLLHELFNYDGLTGKWVNRVYRGSRARAGQPAGCVNKEGYVVIKINGTNHYSHRLAWVYTHGDYPSGKQPFIDHINGVKTDNRIVNLRCSSHSENNRNKQMQSNNTSDISGVSSYKKIKTSGKIYEYWVAHWYDENGKTQRKHFSSHKLSEEAAKQAAVDYRAEQIRLLEINHSILYSDRHGI